MTCDCIEVTNKLLAERYPGAALDVPIRIAMGTGKELPAITTVPVCWLNPGKKKRGAILPVLFARFCPFCGQLQQP